MNGFEPLRRRVIDYTVAGQWQEVYDGPIEECEEYRLQAENAKLRELVADMWRELAVACAEQVTPHETLRKVSDRMRELGVTDG